MVIKFSQANFGLILNLDLYKRDELEEKVLSFRFLNKPEILMKFINERLYSDRIIKSKFSADEREIVDLVNFRTIRGYSEDLEKSLSKVVVLS